MPSPIPKRQSERRRRNSKPAESVQVSTKPRPPRVPSHWTPLAKEWLKSLKQSGQAQFYEQSDWTLALLGGELLNDYAQNGRAATIENFLRISSTLLVSEGDRRRAYIELERASEDEPAAKASDDMKRRLGLVKDAG